MYKVGAKVRIKYSGWVGIGVIVSQYRPHMPAWTINIETSERGECPWGHRANIPFSETYLTLIETDPFLMQIEAYLTKELGTSV